MGLYSSVSAGVFGSGLRRTAVVTLLIFAVALLVFLPAEMASAADPPTFMVGLDWGGLSGEGWPAGIGVTVTADDPETIINPDTTLLFVTNAEGGFSGFEVLPGLEPGWVITVTDGVTPKTHLVRDISVTDVNLATEVVRGTADPSSDVWCNPFARNDAGQWATADGSGNWVADFSAYGDVTLGSSVGVQQQDEDFDSTYTDRWMPPPQGWQYNAATAHYYLLHEDGLPWTEAEQHAIEHGGHLVTINSAAEEDWLTETFGTEYWIGMNDIAVEDNWVWASGEPTDTYQNWLTGEPNDSDPGEDAANLTNMAPIGWNDVSADGDSQFVIEAAVPLAADAVIGVSPDNPRDHVWGEGWLPASDLTLVVEDPGITGSPDFNLDFTADANGYFELYDLPFDIAAGQTVSVSDGATTKSVEVDQLTIDNVDAEFDVISGHATPGSTVRVEFFSAEDVSQEDLAADGTWSVDFTLQRPMSPGDFGWAYVRDEDGDITQADWRVPRPTIAAHANDDMIEGWDFQPSSDVTITVSGPGGPDLEVKTTTDGDGNFNTWELGITRDIQPGDLVTVTDGESTKDTTVVDLQVDDVNTTANTVSGTAPNNSQVGVEINADVDDWVVRWDASDGTWMVDFTVPGPGEQEQVTWDIKPGTDGAAFIEDSDGDRTKAGWRVPDPRFTAHLHSGVDGWDWQPSSDVTITMPGSQVKVMTDNEGNFNTWDIDIGNDIQPGDLITVTDGATTKNTTVVGLEITDVDPANDTETVSGTTSVGSGVAVEVNTDSDEWVVRWPVITDGNWIADFLHAGPGDQEKATWNIEPGTEGSAWVEDGDGDRTQADWRVPAPAFNVFRNERAIDGWDWAPGATATITVGDPASPTFEATTTVYLDGWFDLGLPFDIMPGQTVTVSDGATTKTTIVANVAVTGVDVDANTVSGTAGRDAPVHFFIYDVDVERDLVADNSGNWAVDLSGDFVLVPGTAGGVNQWDDDGDGTTVHWHVPKPAFQVDPNVNTVEGWDWAAGEVVTVTVDPLVGSEYQTTVTADGDGSFMLSTEGDYDLTHGDLITVTDGVTTKDTVVTALELTEVDIALNKVSGVAEAGTLVDVWANTGAAWVGRRVTASSGGTWTADFSNPGNPGEEQTLDLVAGSRGQLSQTDADEDYTIWDWRVPTVSTSAVGTPIGWDSSWVSTDVSVTLTASDVSGPGVERIEYSVTPLGGTPSVITTTTNPATLPLISVDGTYTLEYRAVDNDGGMEDTHAVVIQIDKTEPSRPDTPTASTITQSSVVLTWAPVPDPTGSGPAGYQVYKGGVKIADVTGTSYTVNTGLSAGATYSFTVAAVDVAGNASAQSDARPVTMLSGGGSPPPSGGTPPDTTPPTVSAVVSPSGWTNGAKVDVTITAADSSGNVTLSYSGGTPQTGASPQTGVVSVIAEGATTVTFSASDAAGLTASGSAVAYIDRTPPPVPAAPSYTTLTADSVTLSWVAVTDALSGTASYDLYDGVIRVANVTGTSRTITGLVAGSAHSYSLVAIDNAGNASARGAVLDVTVPSGEGSGDVPTGTNVTETVSVPAPDGGTLPVTAVFSNVTKAGELTVTMTDKPPHGADATFKFMGDYWDVSFSGTFTGTIQITFPYDPKIPDARARNLKLMHWKNNGWEDVPVTIDLVNHTITGTLTSLSPIALVEPATADRTTKVTLTKKIVPTAYGKAAGVVATLSDASGTPLPGRTLVLEKSYDNVTWSFAATMTPTPGKPGSYTGSLKSYRTSGRTYVRVRFVGDDINDGSTSATWYYLPKAKIVFFAKVARRVLTVTGSIVPKHTGATTVKVTAQRIVNGKVKATKTLTIRLAKGKTAFSGKLALTEGTWRIKIIHADATHASSASVARTVKVR